MGNFSEKPLRPDMDSIPSFDPMYGFENERKERVMKVTLEEMESAKIPLEERGYCAHHYIIYNSCRRRVWPLAYRCNPEKHDYLHCKHDDYVIRMKEYERERRLLARAQRLERRKSLESLE